MSAPPLATGTPPGVASHPSVSAPPDRRLVFDLIDCNGPLRAPRTGDVNLRGQSLETAGRDQGLDRRSRAGIVTAAGARYRDAMHNFAGLSNLDVWYARLEEEALTELAKSQRLASRREIKQQEHRAQKARNKDSLRALAKLTRQVDGEPRFISDPPLIVPVEELAQELPPGEIEG